MCSLRAPRFVGSNLAELDGFFQDIKILSMDPESEISGSLKNLNPENIGLVIP